MALNRDQPLALMELTDVRDRPEANKRVVIQTGACMGCDGYMCQSHITQWSGKSSEDEMVDQKPEE